MGTSRSRGASTWPARGPGVTPPGHLAVLGDYAVVYTSPCSFCAACAACAAWTIRPARPARPAPPRPTDPNRFLPRIGSFCSFLNKQFPRLRRGAGRRAALPEIKAGCALRPAGRPESPHISPRTSRSFCPDYLDVSFSVGKK